METLKTILTRRSVRTYLSDAIPEPTVRTLLEAAMAAPSALDQQPWQFVVATGGKVRQALLIIDPASKGLTDAPVGILVCGDMRLVKLVDFWVQDVSACCQNLLLAAHDAGLGAVWTGLHPMPDRTAAFRALFGLPEEIVPFAFIPMGVPAAPLPEKETFRPERIHSGKWTPGG